MYGQRWLIENAKAIFDAITKKISAGNVKNIYFKLSMGKPHKVV